VTERRTPEQEAYLAGYAKGRADAAEPPARPLWADEDRLTAFLAPKIMDIVVHEKQGNVVNLSDEARAGMWARSVAVRLMHAVDAAEPPALDVERLARAFGALDWEPFWTETDRDADGMIEVTFDHARFAERLAAEYARLAREGSG
jgi:hypothetical protein